MKIFKVEDKHITMVEKYCDECKRLGWVNNSSLDKLKFYMVYKNQGTYFAIQENNEIVSLAGCYKFLEYDKDGWRIFYRSATLPKKAKNKGLHRGTGLRGRLYLDAFLNWTSSGDLYFTTNVSNDNWNGITRYHRHMIKESSMKDSYVDYVETTTLWNTEQAIWKLNNEKYYSRSH